MKRPLKIALGHVRHYIAGKHSSFMPVGIGYIGAYTISQLGADKVEVRLYDNPDILLQDIEGWRPDILGLAHYCWNSELNSLIFRHAKQHLPDIVCVGGGPDFSTNPEDQQAYLQKRPEVDFFCLLEGEIPFALLAQKVQAGATRPQLRSASQAGFVSLHPETGDLLLGKSPERLLDMDIIPSPYVMGLMDQWFDGQHPPSLETTRGCPYTCGFCTQGEKRWSKIARFSIGHLKEELEYIAKKMRAHPGVLLAIFDSNFGMYTQDEEIAEFLRYLQDNYGWPNAFDVTTGKSHHERILHISDRLRGKMKVQLAVQSMHQPTLQAIRRKNLLPDRSDWLQGELMKRGMTAPAETIMPLPEETKESYFAGIKTLMTDGIQEFTSYTTMLLKGTYLASHECRQRYQMTTRFRIIPRQLGEYVGHKCFEIEEVCVATNTFSFDDYVECRSFGFIAHVFTHFQYSAFHHLISELQISTYDWLQAIWQIVKSGEFADVSKLNNEYMDEVVKELFISEEEIYRVFSQPGNYEKLLRGEIGDNLMRKYTIGFIVFHFEGSIDIASQAIINLFGSRDKLEALRHFLTDFKKWMLSTRNWHAAFADPGYLQRIDSLVLNHDVESWFNDREHRKPFEEYRYPVNYQVSCKTENASAILSDVRAVHGGDASLTLTRFLESWSPDTLWRKCERTG